MTKPLMEDAMWMSIAALTLVVVVAHPDDETPIAPMLARYAREGVEVHVLVATDGGEGTGGSSSIARAVSGLRGAALVEARAAEARCAMAALGAHAPVLLGFPDGRLGDYPGDRSLIYRLTERIAGELQRIRPDAVVTWGPDGGTGHPDHRLVSGIVMQLARAGAPGVPERIFYMTLPAEGMRAMNPQRGAPPLLIPEAKYVTVHVPFSAGDLERAERAMRCHRTQFADEVVTRVVAAAADVWSGRIPLIPALPTSPASDLFTATGQR